MYVTRTAGGFEMSARVTDYHGEVRYTHQRQGNDFRHLAQADRQRCDARVQSADKAPQNSPRFDANAQVPTPVARSGSLMMRSRMAETCERFADAIAELKVALQWAAINRSKDDEAQAALDLSKTYVACGNLGLAKSALAQSIAIKPGYPDVVAAMRDLESKPAPAK